MKSQKSNRYSPRRRGGRGEKKKEEKQLFYSLEHDPFLVLPTLECRPGCGACCIAPSISSPIPGMPAGKPAGVRCVQLTEDNLCKLFGHPDRPAVCSQLRPHPEMCGTTAGEAMAYLTELEQATRPV